MNELMIIHQFPKFEFLKEISDNRAGELLFKSFDLSELQGHARSLGSGR
jgi:hypothetical protein